MIIDIVWVLSSKDNEIHSAFKGKAYSFCKTDILNECKFLSLYDYSNAKKCLRCKKILDNIYTGVM